MARWLFSFVSRCGSTAFWVVLFLCVLSSVVPLFSGFFYGFCSSSLLWFPVPKIPCLRLCPGFLLCRFTPQLFLPQFFFPLPVFLRLVRALCLGSVFFFFAVLCFSFLPSVAFFFPRFFSSSPVRSSPLFLFEETRGYLTSTPFLFPFVPLPCSGSPFLLVFPQFFFSFSSPVSVSFSW